MTSVAEPGAKSGSRGRVLWLALVLSLTLNVFFVGGLMWSRLTAPHWLTPAERVQRVIHELDLNGGQRDALRHFVVAVHQRTRKLREDNRPLLEQVWQELGKSQPDQAVIAKLVDQATENRHAYQKDMTVALTGFLGTLSPEQRARFVDLARRRHDRTAEHLRRLVMP